MKLHFTLLILWMTSSFANAQVTDLPDMTSARSGHELIQLYTGDLLAAGGHDGNGYTASTEMFDGDLWNTIDPMDQVRYSFTLEATSDNAIAIGGWDGEFTNHASTEIFYPAFNSWGAGPTLNTGRSNHRSLTLTDGRILVVGGYDGNQDLSSCELIDPNDWSVTLTGSMAEARSSHSLVLLNDGRVLAIGGYNPDLGYQMTSCEIYNPTDGTWTTTGAMATGRDNHSAAVLGDGNVVSAGGRYFDAENNWFAGLTSSEVFDVASGTWSAGSDLTIGSSYSQSYYLPEIDEVLLIAGTVVSGNAVGATFSNNQLNTFGPDSWYEDQSVNTSGRHRQASCMLASGGIVVSGGQDDSSVQLIGIYNSVADYTGSSASLWPNPAQNTVHISGPLGAAYQVFNTVGGLVEEGTVGLDLNVQDWEAGVYTVKLLLEGRTVGLRLLVQ